MSVPLTRNESQALAYRCCLDLTTRETAARMGVHRATVMAWGKSAFGKLGVRSIGAACFKVGKHTERARR